MSTRASWAMVDHDGIKWHVYRELAEEGEPLTLELTVTNGRGQPVKLIGRIPQEVIDALQGERSIAEGESP